MHLPFPPPTSLLSGFATCLRPAAAALMVLLAWIGAPVQAADAPAPPAGHPVVGTWSWPLFGGTCVETFQYRPDGTLLGTSGEAVTEWRYTVSPQTSPGGFYRVDTTTVRHNGKKDCSGDVVDEAGLAGTSYVQFSPAKDRHLVCKAESLAACFGPLTRVK